MKIETVNAVSLRSNARLDSKYFLSPGIRAAQYIAAAKVRGVPCLPLGGSDGIARIWQPSRFSKVEAASSEEKIGYLRPYDVFEYLPRAVDYLSVKRTPDIERCRLKRGMLLQTCSGRNLGPAVFVDDYLTRFAIGGDMIRIEIDDLDLRTYTLAFMQSPTGQALLTQGKTGSVIDHLSRAHIAKLEIPLIDQRVRSKVISKMNEAIRLREEARLFLATVLSKFEGALLPVKRAKPEKEGWTIKATELGERLDAAYYDPLVHTLRRKLTRKGGVPVRSVATVIKPGGRYKTVYVDDKHGKPILSGSQLLQWRPINLRYMPERAFKKAADYKVRKNWIAYQADGRAEDALGLPILITDDRDGWLASGHVGRVINKPGVEIGWLYLALRSWAGQVQIKSLASGSVVDSTFPWDMESVVLPPNTNGLSKTVVPMWQNFAKAQRLENEAIALIEFALGAGPQPLEIKFRELVARWKSERSEIASFAKMAMHPAYQEIIEMGQKATPLILKEMRRDPDHWFWALNAIEGVDPVPEVSRGKFAEMTTAWIDWGIEKGLIPK